MQIYRNKRKRLFKKRVQLPRDWFGTSTWPPFHCFGTQLWPLWRHVKTLYTSQRQPCYVIVLTSSPQKTFKLIIKKYVKSASKYFSIIPLGIWCSLMTPDKALKWGPPKVLLTVHRHAIMQDTLKIKIVCSHCECLRRSANIFTRIIKLCIAYLWLCVKK